MSRTVPFTFIQQADYDDPDAFVARIRADVSTKDELLRRLAEALRFPDYFGHNWDALSDCLRDLSWLRTHRIILQHEDLPIMLEASELKTYLEILSYCVKDWRPGEEHELVVVFPEQSYEKIKALLAT